MVKAGSISNYLIVLLLFFITINHTISYGLIILILLFWIVEGSLKKKLKTYFTDKLALTFIALFGIHLVGLLWTENMNEGLKILSKQKIYLFAPLIISSLDKKYAEYALKSFLIAIFISEIYSIYLYFTNDISSIGSLPSPYMHHMHFSLILAFTFGYLISEINFASRMEVRYFLYLMFALLTLIVLFINKGRIGQLAILPVLFVLAIGKFRLSFFKSIITVVFTSIFLFTIAYQLSGQFKERVDKAYYEFNEVVGTEKRDSIACRFEMWDYAIKLGSQNVFAGIGTGDSIDEMNQLLGKKGFKDLFTACGLGIKYQFNPHNNFILFYMLFGAIGLTLLLGVIYYQFKIAIDLNSLSMIILLSVTVVGMMTTSLVSIHIKYMMFYAFVLSVLYIDSQKVDVKS